MDNRRLIIIIGALLGILLLLIIISSIFGAFKGGAGEQGGSITPVPRSGHTFTSGQQAKIASAIKNTGNLSEDQQNKLREAAQKMPVSTPDFDIGYSSLLNKFFVNIKSGQGP